MDQPKGSQDVVSSQSHLWTGSRHRILIVEDDWAIAQRLVQILIRNDYVVLGIEESGRDAIEFAKGQQPDAILMDVRIQGDLNGIETAVVIQGYAINSIPVIFLTGMPSTSFPVLAAVEPYFYLRKPVRDEELLSTLQFALNTKS